MCVATQTPPVLPDAVLRPPTSLRANVVQLGAFIGDNCQGLGLTEVRRGVFRCDGSASASVLEPNVALGSRSFLLLIVVLSEDMRCDAR